MKHLLPILFASILFSGELEVDGDLKVTGSVESTTIDSLKAVIAQLQAQVALLQANSSNTSSRLYNIDIIVDPNNYYQMIIDLNELTGENHNWYIVTPVFENIISESILIDGGESSDGSNSQYANYRNSGYITYSFANNNDTNNRLPIILQDENPKLRIKSSGSNITDCGSITLLLESDF